MPTYKGVEINTKPTDSMVNEAQRGLDWRKEHGRGGTEVGIARARDISNRKELSIDTVKRMVSYFARHEVDKQAEGFNQGEEGYPSNGRIAWALWGGDAGMSWANRINKKINTLDERMIDLDNESEIEEISMDIENRAEPNELEVGDFVEWQSSGGMARGEIISIHTDGDVNIPDSDFELVGTEDNPAALIAIYNDEGEKTDRIVGHRFSTLEKIDPIRAMDNDENDRKASIEVNHRSMSLDASPINEDKRTVRIAISSEEPVERSFGNEVLEHTEEAVDLSFLASGRAPLLLDHDPEKQIGVIESVDLDGSARRLRATVRFGKGALANEAFTDVLDGIRANISVGYSIKKMERDSKRSNTYVAKSWRPVEASLVSIPADVTVGVGRSSEPSKEPTITNDKIEVNLMSEVNTVDVADVEAQARKAAQKNASQIIELGQRHSRTELAQRAISEGKSIEEFRGELLEVIGSEAAVKAEEIGMTQKEVKRFSLMRAIHALANPTDRRAQEAAAFEFECSRAAAEQYGATAQGIMLPREVLRNWKRDLNSSDDAALFTDDFRGGDFIDVLRNASSVMQAGARMLNGLSGDVKIPRKSAASTAAWIATEGGASSESEMTVGSVSMTPKSLGAYTDITRQLMIQSSLDVESLVRDDLAQALATAIDKAGLEGTGASGQPTGVLSTSGVNTVTAFAAANPTFAEVVTLETAVAEDNALMGSLAYILPAGMYGALKTTEKASGTAQFVVEPGGSINGYRGIVSNQATAGNLYFGNFDDLLIGFFGGLDIIVDPYTNSTSGTVRVVALQSCDVAVRHAVSFAFGNDGA